MVRRKANISPSLTFNSKMGRFDDEDEEEEPIDGDDFRDAVEQVFDEERSSQITQEGRAFADTGERIEPEDLFERTLEEAGVQLRDYGDDVTRTFIVDEDLNHAGFVRKLTDVLAESNKKQKDFFEAFERNVRDERKLEIVLMPSDSAGFGQQDTVMRGLLLVPSLQKPVFRLVIDKMDYYALKASQNEKSVRLTQWLLAQFRYLETVYDSRALFDCIFQVELMRWPPAIRNALIDALPEVLVDVDVQQDVAKNLHEMFDKQQQVGPDPDSMRLAILRCLSLLNINVDTLEPIRAALLSSLKTASGSLVPEIVHFCLETIGAKEKGAFKEILEGIRSNLNLSRFKNDNYADTDQDPVTQVMHEITVKVRFDESHFAKDTVAFLRTGIDTEGRKTFKEFDVLLGIAVFEDQLCQERVLTEFRHQITNSVEDSFGKLITSVLELQAFIRSRFKALLRLIEQLVWAADMVVAEFGARMYKSLFLAFDGDYRQEVVIAMTSDHVNSVESETTVVLGCLKQLAKSHPSLMLPYAVFVQSLFDTIGYLTMDNVRTLFEVMVTLYAHVDDEGDSSADDFHIAINKFLVSSSARDNVWGVLGMLMQLKQELNARSKSEDEKERMIEQTLGLLDKCTKPNAKVRAVFYEQMAEIFLSNPQNIPRSAALVNWYDGLCAQFRDEFFKTRPAGKENSLLGLEKKGFVNSESAEWLQLSELISDANKADEKTETRLVTLVPLFRLLRAFARVHREWDNAVDDNLNGLLFTLEANLSLSNCADAEGSADALSKCHTLYYCIRWLREIVNTFSDAKLGEENQAKVAELLQKRYAHMVACHRELEQIIKKIGRYPLPSEQLDACQTVVVYNVEQPKKKPAVKKEKKAKKAKKEKEEKEKEEDGGGTADSDDDAPTVENDQAEIDAESADDPDVPGSSKQVPGKVKLGRKGKAGAKQTSLEQITLEKFQARFTPLKLCAVALLLKDNDGSSKRILGTLLQELIDILKATLPQKHKRSLPWLSSAVGNGTQYHGGLATIWRLVTTVIPAVTKSLQESYHFFRTQMNNSQGVVDNFERNDRSQQIAELLRMSLQVLTIVFSSNELTGGRREDILTKLHRTIKDEEVEWDEERDDVEILVVKFLLLVADCVPVIDCATAVLDVMNAVVASDVDEQLQRAMAEHAMSFLKREWVDSEGRAMKGATFNQQVKHILESYLNLRTDDMRLLAIQWLLSNQLALLVESSLERRRTFEIESLEPCQDDQLRPDGGLLFGCFSLATFSMCFKVLYTEVNKTVTVGTLKLDTVRKYPQSRLDDCSLQWKRAASCFCLLSLFVRIAKLRNASMLTTAMREGKRFMQAVSSPSTSSFLYLLEDKQFHKYAANAAPVLKCIQIGNRALQSIATYARKEKLPLMMQLVPELRAVGEALLRSVHRAVVSADCDDAFQVGLLKSRDIDGAEISEEAVVVEETPADTDQPDGNDEGAEEQDDSEQEEEDADDMDIADDDNDNRSATF